MFSSGFSKEAGDSIFNYRRKYQSYKVITKANGRLYNLYQNSNKKEILWKKLLA